MGGTASVAAATAQIEDWGQLNTFMGEVSQTKGVTGSLARTVTRKDRAGGSVDMGPSAAQFTPAGAKAAPVEGQKGGNRADKDRGDGKAKVEVAPADLIVVAGGNLALIYFNASKERMTLDEIETLYPDLAEALANHPGIGLVMVRTKDHGAVAVGKRGIHFLDEDRVEGEDPLEVYGELAAAALRRLDQIENVGDMAVVSLYDPETGEIAAFEELIGAHGGLGGAQTRPFLLYPTDWELDQGPLIGAPMVYQQLRSWMEGKLGMTFGLTRAAATGSKATAATPSPATTASVETPPAS